MSKKGGYYCAFKNCRGLSRRDKRSFFRFPKDPQRSKQWVKACDRSDLLEKTPIELFNSYRVCAKHFTDSMFLNDLRNRLQPNSVPMQLEPLEDCNESPNIEKPKEEMTDCQDQVAKILSNCILQKISADEFFKATGFRINEPVSAVKTNEGYLQNTSRSDHIYANTKANNVINITGDAVDIDDINTESPNNFSIEALSYQDLINSIPMSLISTPSTQSSLETSDLSFIISDKPIDVDKMPETIIAEQEPLSPLHVSNNFNSLEAMSQIDLNLLKNKLEETTQTEFNFVNCNEEKISPIKSNFTIGIKLDESMKTEANFTGDTLTQNTQTDSSFLKDKLNKRKLKKALQIRKHEIRELKNKIKQNVNIMDNITLEQYELLTEKFFPKETSDFIKIQAQLFKKKTTERKYSIEFRKQCLSLFLSGPKTYKNLQKLFCLPEVRDLQTLKL